MPRSMRTITELAKAVEVLQTRDRARAREVKALRAAIELRTPNQLRWIGGGGGGKDSRIVHISNVGDVMQTHVGCRADLSDPRCTTDHIVPPRPVSAWQRFRIWLRG